ncbi:MULTISPECIES: NAD(P)/FAD-dependent oxidoreductase [Pseudophaeobacter]|jgi:predicted NAD/FAD-binding protein|uniref:NAD(P)/FAD-dependent oxidoreductase n=1 Tax=Pseudophaeobacter TaxID=1541822 RepID=UPI00242DA6B2|nr:FAD-dependent oxidoreductase [Pseudophaeobacter profundi]
MLDQTRGPRKRIAVVGGGISGLSAAYYLSAYHDVTLFEADDRLGGHARTVLAGKNGDQPVDTGFIVFNYATYPYLTRLFHDLNVPVMKSDMSFGVSMDNSGLEYGLNDLRSIFAQKRNLARPEFYGMIADIVKFGKNAESAAHHDDITIGDLVKELGLGTWFRDKYLMPMCGAIWSTPVGDVDAFPAKSLVRFFRNHALLAGTGKHQWWTVKGGSIEYVRRLQAALLARGCTLRIGAPVRAVQRSDLGVSITCDGATEAGFDELILACHSDQALAILGQGGAVGAGATELEAQALGSISYQPNTAVLHCDVTQMPKRRACWSSWTYRAEADTASVTYWMNKLQGIPEQDPLFVTLNPANSIQNSKIYDRVEFAHPVFNRAALQAQKTLRHIQGQNRTWFAGAYNRHGFHEDGIASAMRIVQQMTTVSIEKGSNYAHHGQSPKNAIPVDLRTSA